MEQLIVLIHGLSNSSNDKEERLFKKLKDTYYSSVSKSHIEKNIRAITRIGFMFSKEFLKKMEISENIAASVIQSRFISN